MNRRATMALICKTGEADAKAVTLAKAKKFVSAATKIGSAQCAGTA